MKQRYRKQDPYNDQIISGTINSSLIFDIPMIITIQLAIYMCI